MAIYPPTPDPFNCAICGKNCPRRWQAPAHHDSPPLCRICEQEWGVGQYGDINPDRRIAKQISALANALAVEAHRSSLGLEAMYGPA